MREAGADSAPTLVIGMHRAGTSALTRVLERLGFFCGAVKDANDEALFFQVLNIWVMENSGARWDVPGPMRYFWEHAELVDASERYVRGLLEGRAAESFWGRPRWLGRSGRSPSLAWGWKDPRNTFTLPFWLRLYPDARVIDLRRHGVDVAASLRRRARKGLDSNLCRLREWRPERLRRPRRRHLAPSARCLTLEGAFSLWREYMEQANRVARLLPAGRRMEISFEELLASPEATLARLRDFCGLPCSDATLAKEGDHLDGARALAFANDPELLEFAERKRSELRELGY